MLGHARLVASHFVDNPASGRVLRKLGFQPTGKVRLRHSCGRGEEAPAVEYTRDLDADEQVEMRAA
jgi:RimJ/RimL family protein N-acetyltransferase